MEQLGIFIVIIYCEKNRVRGGPPKGRRGTTGFKTGLFYADGYSIAEENCLAVV